MQEYSARVEVAHDDGLTEELDQQVSGALGPLRPSVRESGDGAVEVQLDVAAETLMEATISAVSGVWTATGGEPVAVDVARQDAPADEE